MTRGSAGIGRAVAFRGQRRMRNGLTAARESADSRTDRADEAGLVVDVRCRDVMLGFCLRHIACSPATPRQINGFSPRTPEHCDTGNRRQRGRLD